MQSRRNLMAMGAVLVALVALYLLTSHRRERLDTTGGFVKLVDGTVSTDEVFGIEAWHGMARDKALTLAKRGDAWVVSSRDDAPANLNKIRSLLGNVEGLEGEVRSDQPGVLADYGLSDSTGVHLVLKKESGEERLHLVLGKRSGNGAFVRKNGSPQAILAATNLLGDFGMWGEEATNPDPKQWLDLEVYKCDREQVHTLTLVHEGKTIELKKEFATPPAAPAPTDSNAAATPPPPATYEWRAVKPTNFLALKTRGDGILGALSSVRARDMAALGLPVDVTGLDAKADVAIVTLAAGASDTLLFGKNVAGDDTQLYFRVAGRDRTWLVPSYLKQNIFKKPDELKPQ